MQKSNRGNAKKRGQAGRGQGGGTGARVFGRRAKGGGRGGRAEKAGKIKWGRVGGGWYNFQRFASPRPGCTCMCRISRGWLCLHLPC